MQHDDPTLDLPKSPFREGSTVSNRYEIEKLLGVGAFGRVYSARDELLHRTVAIKTMILDRSVDEQQVTAHFLDEARTIAKLDHPNIVPVHDAGIEAGTPWMAMRLVAGESLDGVLRKESSIPVERALRILIQVAMALDHAHRKGVIHRDIKPSNILIERRDDGAEHVWLADFGIAKILSGKTTASESAVAGTPSYMSPEQISGKKVDARTDIFALGCVAYELVAGKRAFHGETYSQVMYNVVHEPPEGFAELSRRGGKRFETVVRRALAKSAEDRYQTFEQLLRAFTAIQETKESNLQQTIGSKLKTLLVKKHEQWDGRNVLEVSGLVKGYKLRQQILKNINLTVPTGSIYAILGRNGSGKTTLIRTCIGLYRGDAGRIAVFGRDPFADGPAILARIGYVPETISVFDWINVGELIQFLKSTYKNWDNGYCYELLGRFELPLDIKIRDLSKGMKTKVSLIAALSHRPEFLILDDPTLGLDQVILREVFESLEEVSRREGTTILIASHAIEQVEKVATHVGLLSEGKLMLSDTLAGLKMRTREVRLTFRDDVPEIRNIDHFKTVRRSGRHLTGVVLDTSGGAMEKLQQLGAEEIEVRELDLSEIFVNFMK